MHNAILQLDVCILETHGSHTKLGRLNILFPILAEQATTATEEYMTLRELEFETLENPDPEESASGKEFPQTVRSQQSSRPVPSPRL